MKRLRREVILPAGSARGIQCAIACVVAVMGLAAVDAGYQLAQVERVSQAEVAEAAARLQRSARIAEARRANERQRRAHARVRCAGLDERTIQSVRSTRNSTGLTARPPASLTKK